MSSASTRITSAMPIVDGRTGIAPIARRLGLSGPALYRKLAACGVEYANLQRDIRRELALRLSADPQFLPTDIAQPSGYSEPSAFSRAFRSWIGLPPLHDRRQRDEK